MRRHPTLIPLSRFHRSVLFTAQMAKKNGPKFKGYPTEPGAKAVYAYDFYQNALKAHFLQEETQLFPKIRGLTEDIDQLITTLTAEHQQLRLLFEQLLSTEDKELLLDQLGHQLEAHVRKEERQLFQKIQEAMTEEALQALDIKD